jgi:drug/metabolite transporter (DMT)-like permease
MDRMRPPARLAPHLPAVGLTVAVILWGTSFVATKVALTGFGPLTVIGLRMVLASALMLPFWSRVPAPTLRHGDARWLVLLVVLYPCLYFTLEANAVNLTTASQAGAVSAVVPLLVAVGARVFLGERLASLAVVGLALSIGGVVVLSLGGPAAATSPNPALGNALEFGALAGYAVATLVVKQLSGRYAPWLLTGLQCATGALVFLPALALTSASTWGTASAGAWASVLYLGIAVTLIPAGLFNLAVSRMPAARAALAINLVPVVAILTGWALLGDSLTAVQGLACVVILAGVVLGERGGERRAAGDGERSGERAPVEEPAATRSAPA